MSTLASTDSLAPDAPAPAVSRGRERPALDTVAARGVLRRVLAEPLTHFLVAGIAIFAVSHWIEQQSTRYVIDIGPAEITRITNTYRQQYGAVPSREQVLAMVDNYIREEVFLREGLALGLDRNDEIVRRRIAQKFDFLQQDLAVPADAPESALRAWFDAHRADYSLPAKRSFEHVYYAIDARGEEAARSLAVAASDGLRAANPARAGTVGDAFPGAKSARLLSQRETDRLFGGDDFAAGVFALPAGQWSAPLRSGFGWHVVRVSEEQPARERDFAEVRDSVRADYREALRAQRNTESYRRLLSRYTVQRTDVAP